MWEKICGRYHTLNPPQVTDKHGRPGEPRDKLSMINKWRKMGGFLSKFLKCVAFALANHKSGESASQDLDNALEMYETNEGHPFAYLEEYKILSVNHKWSTMTAATDEQAARRAGVSQQTPLHNRLEVVAEASPTSLNTRKPLGVKKARAIKAGLAEAEREIAEGEKKMEEWAENFSARKTIGLAAVQADIDRTEMMASFADDFMMLRDTSLIPAEMLEPFLSRRALGITRIFKRSRVAAAAAVAAAEVEAAAVIAVAAAAAAAAIAVAEAAAAAVAEEARAAFAAVVAAASAQTAAEAENAATQDAFDASAAGRARGFWGDEEYVG